MDSSLLGLRLDMEAMLGAVGITGLLGSPKAWLQALVSVLRGEDKHALFCTCKPLATLVVQCSPGLTLQPANELQDDFARRATVLGLAASSQNVHLVLQGHAIAIDNKDMWQSITKLTLCNVPLCQGVCNRLYLQHLRNLHTLQLTGLTAKCTHPSNLETLQQAIASGGLQKVRMVKCRSGDVSLVGVMQQQLASVLGSQVTHLTLQGLQAIENLQGWRVLEELTIEAAESHEPNLLATEASEQLFKHSMLRRVCFLNSPWFNLPLSFKDTICNIEQLIFRRGVCAELLARLPRTLRHVAVHGRLQVLASATSPACLGSNIRYIPVLAGERVAHLGLPAGMPFFALQGSLDSVLLQKCTEHLSGALVLQGATLRACDVPGFALISPDVHTLVVADMQLHEGTAWQLLLQNLPSHITHLIISMSEHVQDWVLQLLQQPAPLHLRQLTFSRASWLSSQHVIEVQALAAERWPDVTLAIHLNAD